MAGKLGAEVADSVPRTNEYSERYQLRIVEKNREEPLRIPLPFRLPAKNPNGFQLVASTSALPVALLRVRSILIDGTNIANGADR